MEQLSFIAYGDVGPQTGRDITELSVELNNQGILEQLYCRGVTDDILPQDCITQPIPFGRTVPRVLSGFSQFLLKNFNSRYYSERLFDISSSKNLDEDRASVHLHHTPRYPKTLEKGKEMGRTTVVKMTTEYAESYNERVRSQYDELDIDIRPTLIDGDRAKSRLKVLNECDQVLAISSFVENSLIDAGIPSDKISVTPLGVRSCDYPVTNRNQEKYRVLYVGTVSIAKGVPHLLRAWELNNWGNREDVELYLCGTVTEPIKRLISSYNFDNVYTPGYVDPIDYYSKSTIFTFPSISDGFGKAPLEAMASGLPIVTTENTGMPDIMRDGREGFIVPVGDPSALAERLLYLKDNPNDRDRMGNKALETAASQTWSRHASLVIDSINAK